MPKLIISIAVVAAAVLSGTAQARGKYCPPKDPLCAYAPAQDAAARAKFCPPKDPLCAY